MSIAISALVADTALRQRLFVPWLVLAAGCATMMWLVPGEETVPYHLAWIGLCIAYAVEPWPWAQTLAATVVYTAVTGGALVVRAATGVLGWQETAEIPLMAGLALLVVWNVRKRHLAYSTLSAMAEKERQQAVKRERLSRMTSHEMRTPATIAIGYAEMLLAIETDAVRRNDLEVIRDELGRLVLAGDRLIRTIRMHDHDEMENHDLPALLREVADRWSVLADRNWVVTCDLIRHVCSSDRMRACLDTLVENAVRYTDVGDTVRILGHVDGSDVVIGVADSGPGLHPMMLEAVNRDEFDAANDSGSYTAEDPKAQTGLGLALVWEAARGRGGRVVAGTSEEGGALVTIRVPTVGGPHRLAVPTTREPSDRVSVARPA